VASRCLRAVAVVSVLSLTSASGPRRLDVADAGVGMYSELVTTHTSTSALLGSIMFVCSHALS
jgi:hypothetical protein